MSFKSIGHFFSATVLPDLDVLKRWLVKEQPAINNALDTVATVGSMADPALAPLLATVDSVSKTILGDVLATVQNADAAAQAKGLSITLDAATIASAKSILTAAEAAKPGSTKAPAGLPVVLVTAPAAS